MWMSLWDIVRLMYEWYQSDTLYGIRPLWTNVTIHRVQWIIKVLCTQLTVYNWRIMYILMYEGTWLISCNVDILECRSWNIDILELICIMELCRCNHIIDKMSRNCMYWRGNKMRRALWDRSWAYTRWNRLSEVTGMEYKWTCILDARL